MWYYTLNNQQAGPVEEAEIMNLVAAGTITPATLVWTTGMANWQPIGQSALASLVGGTPSQLPAVPGIAPAVLEDPEVSSINKLYMWFWISLIGILVFGVGLVAAIVLFFILIWKAWNMVQREGIRATADQAVAWCNIPGWNFYWCFPAFRGLAKEFNDIFDKESIPEEKFNLDLATWMLICLYASPITFGVSLIPFVVLWIMYTNKVKNAMVAVHNARK